MPNLAATASSTELRLNTSQENAAGPVDEESTSMPGGGHSHVRRRARPRAHAGPL